MDAHQSVDERLARLERTVRQMKLALGCMALAGAAGLLAAATNGEPDEIRARSFVVVNGSGETLAEMSSVAVGGHLALYRRAGSAGMLTLDPRGFDVVAQHGESIALGQLDVDAVNEPTLVLGRNGHRTRISHEVIRIQPAGTASSAQPLVSLGMFGGTSPTLLLDNGIDGPLIVQDADVADQPESGR